MVIRNLTEINFDLITFETPIKNDDDIYVSEIKYNNEPFIIQTPKLYFKSHQENTLELILSKEFFKVLNKIDNKLITTTAEKSGEWFNNELTSDNIREIFLRSVNFPIDEEDISSIKLKPSDKVKVYDKHNPELIIDEIDYNTPLIAVISLKYLLLYRHNCKPYWEFHTIKVKSMDTMLKTCLIEDDSNEKEPKVSENVKLISFEQNSKLF